MKIKIFRSLRITIFLFLAFIFNVGHLSSAVSSDGNSPRPELTAKEIMSQMSKVYASCKTYRDAGVVSTKFSIFGITINSWTDTKPFTTVFLRPDHFRFEFKSRFNKSQSNWDRYIVHSELTKVQTWWDIRPGAEKEESLSMAIAGATGVSGGSAHTIPVLLLSKVICGWRLTDLNNLSMLKDGSIESSKCWRIRGENHSGDRMILWIEKDNYLIKRIETYHRFYLLLRTDTNTDYKSAVNVIINPKELRFDPPKM